LSQSKSINEGLKIKPTKKVLNYSNRLNSSVEMKKNNDGPGENKDNINIISQKNSLINKLQNENDDLKEQVKTN
jgi:hypothetical protein